MSAVHDNLGVPDSLKIYAQDFVECFDLVNNQNVRKQETTNIARPSDFQHATYDLHFPENHKL